jgi:hypothetical protein
MKNNMKNISKKVNLSLGTDGMFATIVNGMFATTINCVNSADWYYIVDFLSDNREIEFSSDICKKIKNKLEKQYEKD